MNYLHIPKDKGALKICRLKDLQILYQSPTKDPRCLFHFLALCPDPDFWVLGNYQMGGLGDLLCLAVSVQLCGVSPALRRVSSPERSLDRRGVDP